MPFCQSCGAEVLPQAIVCVKCGHVDEFEDEMIEKRQREKAESLGYRLLDHSLIMHGECVRKNCPYLKGPPGRRSELR